MAEQVVGSDRTHQAAAGVDDHELRLRRAAGADHLGREGAQRGGAAGAAVAEHHQVRLRPWVEADRLPVVDAEQQAVDLARARPDVLEPDLGRQPPDRRGRWSRPGRGDPVDEVGQARCGGVRVDAVEPGQRGQQVVSGRREAASRSVGRDPAGRTAVDLGVERVAEPQLDPGPEQVARRRPQVAPPPRGHHEVDAEGEAPRRHPVEHRLEVGVVGAQVGPAVDHQEHLAVPVARLTRSQSPAVGRPRR